MILNYYLENGGGRPEICWRFLSLVGIFKYVYRQETVADLRLAFLFRNTSKTVFNQRRSSLPTYSSKP